MLPHAEPGEKSSCTLLCVDTSVITLLMLEYRRKEQIGKYDNFAAYDRKRRRPPEWRPCVLGRLCGFAMKIVVGAIHGVEVGHSGDGGFRNGHSLEEAIFCVGVEPHHAGQSCGKSTESHIDPSVVLKRDDLEDASGVVGHKAVGSGGSSAGNGADG